MCYYCVFSEEMEAFAERSSDMYFEFSTLQFFIVLFMSSLTGVTFGAVFYWPIGLGVGGGVFCLLYAILGQCLRSTFRCYFFLLFVDDRNFLSK